MNSQTKVQSSIIGALAKALPELEAAKKNAKNPHFKSSYADLGAVIEALEPLRAHGLWYRQIVHPSGEGVEVETLYIHESGEELSAGPLFMPASKKDAQGFGSALTYARRYSLQAAFGLATEEDDGNAAVRPARGHSEEGAVSHGQAIQYIDDGQWAMLTQLIEASGVPTKTVCDSVKVDNLKAIPACKFDSIISKLNKNLAAKAGAEKEAA